jgi:hypothetical protein
VCEGEGKSEAYEFQGGGGGGGEGHRKGLAITNRTRLAYLQSLVYQIMGTEQLKQKGKADGMGLTRPYLNVFGSSRRTGLAVQGAGVVKMPPFARARSRRANAITAIGVQQTSLAQGTTRT